MGMDSAVGVVGIAGPLIRAFAYAKAHLLPQGEKGNRGSSALEPPSPLVGEGLGVRGALLRVEKELSNVSR